jgi:hypothetical protein
VSLTRSLVAGLAAVLTGLLLLPALAAAHAERPTSFPDGNVGAVPTYRPNGDGPSIVVCKGDSAKRINRAYRGSKLGALRAAKLALLKQCRFRNIQQAVDAASNGTRILVMPGTYRELPSRQVPLEDPKCADMYTETEGGEKVPAYEYHRACPNSQNMIAIVGDGPDADKVCDDKCGIQIIGMGRTRADVLILGDRRKLNVIRADRADGVLLANFTIQYSDFNNIYALETNGFRFRNIETRWSREYGILSFASDHGLYERIDAHGVGDGGVYPGGGPEGHCKRYGIEIRNVDSHDNNMGYSGTAGNGIWVHDSKFHHNSTGMATDSFASGHPGMPQDCAKWERNEIYSNNQDFFNAERDAYCKKPPLERDPKIVCPSFAVPVGTGLVMAGANANIVRDNWIYDNWRSGVRLFWVPAAARGENDPSKTYDTSNDNAYTTNHMGVRPDGTRDPNGDDFWWDEEGRGNCWSDNVAAGGAKPTSDPLNLPGCPGGNAFGGGNPAKISSQVSCIAWFDGVDDPPGCDWFTQPKEPQ